jgi:hypothetical protein
MCAAKNRTLQRIARENAVEGCVRETFGAALASLAAERTVSSAAARSTAHCGVHTPSSGWQVELRQLDQSPQGLSPLEGKTHAAPSGMRGSHVPATQWLVVGSHVSAWPTTTQGPVERLFTQVWVPVSSQTILLSVYCAPHCNNAVHGSPSVAGWMHVAVEPSSDFTQARPDAQRPSYPHVAPSGAPTPHDAGAGPPRHDSPGPHWAGEPQGSPAFVPDGTTVSQTPDPHSPAP